MKRLFCTSVTDFDGNFESPIIFHIRAESTDDAEKCTREHLVESGYDKETIDETFDMVTFEVTEILEQD
jgi:hypothetical protein